MKGFKRFLGSSRNQFGVAAIVTTLVVLFLKWPQAPDSVTDAELLERVLQIQADLLASVAKYIALIVGVLTGGTSLEDAAQKLFHKGGE